MDRRPAGPPTDSLILELPLMNSAGACATDNRDIDEIDPLGWRSRDEPLSNKVICLREWGTRQVYPLRAPRDSRRGAPPHPSTLQLSRNELAIAPNQVELLYESQSWRVNDRDGTAHLKHDGRPTRQASLLPGAEITVAGRTFVAESPRSIALRHFCSRLLGWGDDRVAVVDHALRAIRLASTGYAALVLRGDGDLVLVAHTIHRRLLGDDAPFVVCDPRRKNTPATVRTPANRPTGTEAFRQASQGTLCVRARRLPPDFEEVSRALQVPEAGVQLMVCAGSSTSPSRNPREFGATQIDIPPLETRRAELPQIVSEYIGDAIDALHVPDGCLRPADIERITSRVSLVRNLAIPDIEKAVLRAVAVTLTSDLTKAAALLGMARVSLERWFRRRGSATP